MNGIIKGCTVEIHEMTMLLGTKTKTQESTEELLEVVEERKIILYDDEVNTFDFVINALVSVCEHDPLQAEQCTLLVHFKGKCDVKHGEYDFLEPICTALLERGLTAEIE